MKISKVNPSSWLTWLQARFGKRALLTRFRKASNGTLQEMEQRVSGAFYPVSAPEDFRQALAENLALIAQRKEYGLIVTHPHPYRLGLWVGLGAGTLATAVAIMVLVFRGCLERRSVA